MKAGFEAKQGPSSLERRGNVQARQKKEIKLEGRAKSLFLRSLSHVNVHAKGE